MPSLIPLDGQLGAAFIGVIVSAVIYGVTCLQVHLYYSEHSSRDRPFLKAFVGVLFALDTLHVALLCHTMYYYQVTNFGDYGKLMKDEWSLLVQVFVGDVAACLCQFFFAYRIYRISGSKNWWTPVLVCIFSLAMLACGTGFMVRGFHMPYFSQAKQNLPLSAAALSFTVAADIVITVGMIYYLWSNRTQFTRTNRVINKLITYTLNTGFLTSIFTIACLIAYVADNSELVYSPFYFVLVRLYSCSFMSTLNMRSYIHTELRNSDDNTVLPLSFRTNKSTVSAQLDAVNPSHSTHSLGKVTATEVAVSSPGGQPYTIRIDRSVHVD